MVGKLKGISQKPDKLADEEANTKQDPPSEKRGLESEDDEADLK